MSVSPHLWSVIWKTEYEAGFMFHIYGYVITIFHVMVRTESQEQDFPAHKLCREWVNIRPLMCPLWWLTSDVWSAKCEHILYVSITGNGLHGCFLINGYGRSSVGGEKRDYRGLSANKPALCSPCVQPSQETTLLDKVFHGLTVL